MVIITLQRDKCIGCNYCSEIDFDNFRMSKKDGKSNLLNSVEKKGFYTARIVHNFVFDKAEAAANACPVKIIKVTMI